MSLSKEAEEKRNEEVNKAISKLDTSDFKYHKLSTQECIKQLRVDTEAGLSDAEVDTRRKEFGSNELDKEDDKTLWERIAEQFQDQLVQILLGAATITFLFAVFDQGDEGFAAFVEPFVIMTILILNAIVAIWQDSNADNALEALMDLQAQNCLVKRNSAWQTIPATELVPGDLVKVVTGNCVPADLRLTTIESISLQAG
jgi:magnesium-transporting ATPase (P-type)